MAKRILCILLCLCLAMSFPLTALAQQTSAIHIRSLEDFLALAENCVLDSYSREKTVYLHCDLDLNGVAFSGIATFGGVFDGQGHTISNLRITGKGSVVGLFRYVQPGGVVRDLNVTGTVTPDGTAETVGAIAGSNSGLIQDCSFEGSVAGSSAVGGIVGINQSGGSVLRCVSRGVVVGQNMTGGIIGYNMGLVESCENHACVNIYTPDETLDLSSIDLSVLMDPSALTAGITVMDTGGVAGYSIGAIYDCVNTASIGYPHIGYNVGGIAGRSSGSISGCVNRASIQGRKDVGGIVGQMEPNVSLNLSEDHLLQLETQLKELEELTRQLQGSFGRLDAAGTHLNNTLTQIDSASASLEALAGYVGDYGGALTEEFNRASLLLQDVLAQLVPVLEQTAVVTDRLAAAMEQLSRAMSVLASASGHLEESLSHLNAALADMQDAGASITEAMEQVRQAFEQLEACLQEGDPAQTQAALEQLQAAFAGFSGAMDQVAASAQAAADALAQQGTWNEETAAAFAQALEAVTDLTAALQQLSQGAQQLGGTLGFDQESFWAALESLRGSVTALSSATSSLQAAATDLSEALTDLETTVDVGGQALDILAVSMAQFAGSLEELTALSQLLSGVVDRVSRFEPIQLPQLDSGASESADALFDSVNSISDELRSILAISDTFSQEAKAQLNAIYEKFTQILSTAMKLTDQVLNTATEGIIKDTSDVDLDAVKAGKVSLCRNEGSISGDINAGGITGAMAIEYQLDPEDDLTGQLSQHRLRSYQAKAIITSCTNLGAVQGKRSYIGGICGRMDMGIIAHCSAFGQVASAGGDYVGGIAGSAAGPIRRCDVKADLSGGKYIGGVAGFAAAVTDCRAMVWLTGQERVGAILGYADAVTQDQISGNVYYALPGSPGAIDGVSYDGCAQAATMDAFQDQQSQQPFDQVQLTFCFADGSVQTVTLPVGTVLQADMVPPLENTAQQILYWEGLEEQLGQAQYFSRSFTQASKAKTSVLESRQTRDDGKPILLLQGSFLSSEKLQLQPLTDGPEALEGWQFAVPAGGSVTQIRYALPEGVEDVDILARDRNGDLGKVPHSRSGSYLVFSLDEGVTAFYVTVPLNHNPWRQYAGIAAGVVLLVAVIAICRGRKRKKAK